MLFSSMPEVSEELLIYQSRASEGDWLAQLAITDMRNCCFDSKLMFMLSTRSQAFSGFSSTKRETIVDKIMAASGSLIDVSMLDNVSIIACSPIMLIEIIKAPICFKLSLGLSENQASRLILSDLLAESLGDWARLVSPCWGSKAVCETCCSLPSPTLVMWTESSEGTVGRLSLT